MQGPALACGRVGNTAGTVAARLRPGTGGQPQNGGDEKDADQDLAEDADHASPP